MRIAIGTDRRECRRHHRIRVDTRVELPGRIHLHHRDGIGPTSLVEFDVLGFRKILSHKDQNCVPVVGFPVTRLLEVVARDLGEALVPVVAEFAGGKGDRAGEQESGRGYGGS